MALYSLTYSIAQDFPGGVLTAPDTLASEIQASAIVTALDHIDTLGDSCIIWFKAQPSGGDQTILDGGAGLPYGTHPAGGLIAVHQDVVLQPPTQVEVTGGSETYVKQERKTKGHYRTLPLCVSNIPANGGTLYTDITIPALTHGLDWIAAHFYAGDADSGDKIVTGKCIFGQIAAVAAPAAQSATQITIAAPIGLLRSTADGGVLDEGFFLSFGTENSTAAAINAVPPPGTGTLPNPQGELVEYEIQRIGTPTNLGNGNEAVTITLFTPLAAGVAPGTHANLVVRAIYSPIELVKGDTHSVGGEAFTSGNLPAGTIVRFGYQNNGTAIKSARGRFATFY